MPDSAGMKITFQLTLREKRLEVRVEAPGGEGRSEAAAPPESLLQEIEKHDPTKIPSATVEKVGVRLYKALANEQIDELVIDTLNDARRESQPVQFELRFDADQVGLTRFPWEMIRNAQGQYLVRDGIVDLTRYITYPQAPPAFDKVVRELPLLQVVSSPPALPPITTVDLAGGKIEKLEDASFDNFMRKLLVERLKLWGLQFDGHGALVLRCRNCDTLNARAEKTCYNCKKSLADAEEIGALAFERGNDANWVPTEEFGSILYNSKVKLAVLLACESAKVGSKIVWSGLAPGLLLAGVPAVIGMQYPVLDNFANTFANEFYAVLTKTSDVLEALRTARRLNIQGAWYSPALYLRRQHSADAPAKEAAGEAVYHTRNVDTAAPGQTTAGEPFLTRLWIRRPKTKPLTDRQLREELGLDDKTPLSKRQSEAEIKFEPVEGRKLRRGEVDVRLQAPGCDVTPEAIPLFVDENVDAPPAIFTVTPRKTGKVSLIFTVYQDGGQIAALTHSVEAVDAPVPEKTITTSSAEVGVGDEKKRREPPMAVPPIPRMAASEEAIRDSARQQGQAPGSTPAEQPIPRMAARPAAPPQPAPAGPPTQMAAGKGGGILTTLLGLPLQAQIAGGALLVVLALFLAGAGGLINGPRTAPTATATPFDQPAPINLMHTITAAPTDTATATYTATPTDTPTPTATSTPTRTPIPYYCGDGVCQKTESPRTCSRDCGLCGNGYCDGGEHVYNCPQDCGQAPGPGGPAPSGPSPTGNPCASVICGDSVCNAACGESTSTCGFDCDPCYFEWCGNGTCNYGCGEVYPTCSDCPVP